MRNETLLNAIGQIDDRYIVEAKQPNQKSAKNIWAKWPLVAALVGILLLCGFAAYELGLFDFWIQQPATDPVSAVQSAIENQYSKEYTLEVRIDTATIDTNETERIRNRYIGSELADTRGWTEDYLLNHFIVIKARYYVSYDHSKTFLDDGYLEQYFYLVQDEKNNEWSIVDNTSPNQLD